jgi:hypothetical protein
MTFTIPKKSTNLQSCMKNVGYRPIDITPEGELNCVRPLGGDYPRFHVYAKDTPQGFVLNLHLDQKKPSYGAGSRAHSGEYEGEIIMEERRRIESMV